MIEKENYLLHYLRKSIDKKLFERIKINYITSYKFHVQFLYSLNIRIRIGFVVKVSEKKRDSYITNESLIIKKEFRS